MRIALRTLRYIIATRGGCTHPCPEHVKQVNNTRAVFRRTTLPCPVEWRRSGQLPASGCMSSKPMHLVRSRRLLRNFPRGHFHVGGGGTVSNWGHETNAVSTEWTWHVSKWLESVTGPSIARLVGLLYITILQRHFKWPCNKHLGKISLNSVWINTLHVDVNRIKLFSKAPITL